MAITSFLKNTELCTESMQSRSLHISSSLFFIVHKASTMRKTNFIFNVNCNFVFNFFFNCIFNFVFDFIRNFDF